MTSYQFDSFTTDNNYVTLFKTTCCGITYGVPRKHMINRDRINFVNYGRNFNVVLGFCSILTLGFSFMVNEQEFKELLYFASFYIIIYALYQYITSKLVICVGNAYFTSAWCCTDHETLLEWYRQQEMIPTISVNTNYRPIV